MHKRLEVKQISRIQKGIGISFNDIQSEVVLTLEPWSMFIFTISSSILSSVNLGGLAYLLKNNYIQSKDLQWWNNLEEQYQVEKEKWNGWIVIVNQW